jgi:diguanylate cyclase (GGDEF)-like protein
MYERPRGAKQPAVECSEPQLRSEAAQAWAHHSSEGVIVLDARASVEFVNERALALLGLRAQAGEAEVAHALFGMLPAFIARSDAAASHVVEVEREGASRWFKVTRLKLGVDLRGQGSEVVLLDDVSVIKQAEAQVTRLNAELARRAVERVELSQTIRELEELALRDPLTSLLNRRGFEERLREEVGRAQRYGSELSLLLVDIDHFKRINDTFGHAAGDVALSLVATLLMEQRRASDVVARYGGEEFAVLAPHTPREGALVLGQRLCAAVREHPFRIRGRAERLSVSVGIATLTVHVDCAEELIFEAADRALYAAKREGRDRALVQDL